MSEFRYNKLTRKWVLFSPNRAKRPVEVCQQDKSVQTENLESCPFETGREHMTPDELLRIGDKDHWRVRVVPNLYHALSIDDELISHKYQSFEVKSGFGAHEVIIETPDHTKQMYHFTLDEFVDYFTAIKLRIENLKKDTRLQYFSLFKNCGNNAGATLDHSHTQLIAMPFIPNKIKEDLEFYRKHKEETQRDFFDDLIYDEQRFKKGLLFENNSFIAFCPYASTFPFEVLVVAQEPICSIIECESVQIYALSEIMEFLFKNLHKALGEFSFNLLIKNGDMNHPDNPNRLHLQILPRLTGVAGFELESDIFINTILPELAAKVLK
ncbi:MAG: galactose-1-phosphate uridylyltransferase [Campylobacterales bacterium]|nr:galactose-1-phosphate uridylyltransferase [Campylobacterales bacterium]